MADSRDIRDAFAERATLFAELGDAVADDIGTIADGMVASLQAGGRIFACGNGGSASQAEHFAAELVGRYKLERDALPAFALTSTSATTTSVANDYSFDHIFARQLHGIGHKGDSLLVLSTSGTSPNVVKACEVARGQGMSVFALTGASGGDVAGLCDGIVRVPSADTPAIQEVHLAVIHLLCGHIESVMFPSA